MSTALASRPTTQPRTRDGKFGEQQRAEDDTLVGTLVQCGLCTTCQAIERDGVDVGEECAAVLGGSCVLSPQNCPCGGH